MIPCPSPALDRLISLAQQKASGKQIFLFLDFDGTLVPIRRDPDKVVLSSRMRNLLTLLIQRIPVAIISGRSLSYLTKTVPPGMILAGNHGLEIQMGRKRFCHPEAADCKAQIISCAKKLKTVFHGTRARIEEKGLTLTFHYRTVLPHDRESVCKTFYETVKSLMKGLKIHKGKMCLEMRPNINWGKEQAMAFILEAYQRDHRKKPIFPIYIGDDETDKAAIKQAHRMGIGLFRGDPTFSVDASGFISSQEKLIRFMKSLLILEKWQRPLRGHGSRWSP